MKLSQLKARIEKLEARLQELEQVSGMHWTKRPEAWKGSRNTLRLKRELERVRDELRELRAWRRGHWYYDDLNSGGGVAPTAPSRSVTG